MNKKAIFAGSFDPIHIGHLKVIKKAAQLFDTLYVVIANNDFKTNQGDLKQRLINVTEEITNSNILISVLPKDKYLATFAKENDIKYLIRSARDNVDFSYELDMSKINKEINDDLETILIIPDYDDIQFSSSKFRDFKIDKNK